MRVPIASEDDRSILSALGVRQVVADGYGLTVTEQRPLGGEVDQNVWVRTSSGDEFLVKVSTGNVTAALRWQETVLLHLERQALDLPVPRLVRTRSGDTMLSWTESGKTLVVRLLTWMPGKMLADLPHLPGYLLSELGTVAARLTQALGDLPYDSVHGSHHWDIRNAHEVVAGALPFVSDEGDRRAVEELMDRFDQVRPLLPQLPSGVVHHDLNDFNVLARRDGHDRLVISGVIDVNDSMFTIRVAELAIAVAYAMLRQADPLRAAAAVVAGFNSVAPLTEDEVAVVFPLAAARLCVNATTWTRRTSESHHQYGRERMRHTWPTLHRLASITASSAEQRLRAACGLPSTTTSTTSLGMVVINDEVMPIFRDQGILTEINLGPSGDFFDERSWSDPEQVAAALVELRGAGTGKRGLTRHLSVSMLRTGPRLPMPQEPATVQVGVRLLALEQEEVRAPLDGLVVRVDAEALTLRHSSSGNADDAALRTCWRGLDASVETGATIRAGEPLGRVRKPATDLGLGPTVLVQAWVGDEMGETLPPEWVPGQDIDQWRRITVDPSTLLGLTSEASDGGRLSGAAVLSLRERRLARSQRAYYRRPPNLVRGRGVWLYDEFGRGYLDAINNVTHVGHAEPRINAAAIGQLRKLNTNSRFIYEGIATYAERLVSTLPAPLEVVFLVCTGSEANDLAVRMARQVTGRTDVVVIDGAYHGNTSTVTGISPNRYKGPGGRGAPDTTHEVMCPDTYRGRYGRDDLEAGRKYADDVARVVDGLAAGGRPPAAFIAESLMGTAGNILFPDGYLCSSFEAARDAGALCISDEVQVGVGRLGTHFWGFQAQGVIPDIVTMGKPLGNGQPIAAVVTTREIADAFDDGMKYFNTFGGNPVSCAIGTTVLDIVEQDDLQANALAVGDYFLGALEHLKPRHSVIGDVRGQGLYLGIELVTDSVSKEPAAAHALAVCEAMMENGVIVYPTGVHDNVLKIKPPMIFSRSDVDFFVATLDHVLATTADDSAASAAP